MSIFTGKSKYELIKEIGTVVNNEIVDEIANYRKKIIEPPLIIQSLKQDLSVDELHAQLTSLGSIGLNLTEQCNFRCGYCTYSGNYEYDRAHSDKAMSKETAMKSIRFFLDLINEPVRMIKYNRFCITFFGGEPLLKIGLIKQIIEETELYISQKQLQEKFDVYFRIATNGYLLNDEVAGYFAEKGVVVDVSLDGPEEDHDRFRRYRNDNPTWATIMANLKNLAKKYPDYYKEKVYYQCTVHPLHDAKRVKEFFEGDNELFDIDLIRFSNVNRNNLNPEAKVEMDRILAEKKTATPNPLILRNYFREVLEGKFNLKDISAVRKFTGTCIPGDKKVFVDSNGRFHMCEKVNPFFPIGDVDSGFDYQKIRQLIRSYNEEVIRAKCWECELWFLCNVCYVHAAKGTELEIECGQRKKSYHRNLQHYLKHLEAQTPLNDEPPQTVEEYFDRLINGNMIEKLKPWVHAVKGTKYYSIYNLITGNLYNLEPCGDIDTISKSLMEAGLIFKTNGVVPTKFEMDFSNDSNRLRVKELQIKINGGKENNCWERLPLGEDVFSLEPHLVDAIKTAIQHIPVSLIRIDADTLDMPLFGRIIKELDCDKLILNVKAAGSSREMDSIKALCDVSGKALIIESSMVKPITDLQLDVTSFFSNQEFNPCFGRQVAIDSNGDIKPCLWSEDVLGSVHTTNLKDLIIAGSFDKYWDTTKDSIEVCSTCEKRYVCNDCRVSSQRTYNAFDKKPTFCNYSPSA